MSTNANLPNGAFITSINGKRCTAVPRTDGSQQQTSAAAGTTSTTEAAQETTTTTSEQDQQQQTTTSQEVESTSTSSTTTSSSSTTTASPESTTQIAAPPPAQTSVDPPPATTRINSSPSPELVQQPSTTQVAVAPAVTTPSNAPSMGSFSLMPEASDSNSSTIGETQTRAQTQVTAPVNSIATSAAAVADSIITDPNVASTTAAAESSVDIASLETPLAENGGESSPGAGNSVFTTLRTSTATTGTEASVTAGQPTVTAIANSSNTGTTIAIVGGVVGGIAIAAFLAFLLWFWRKRSHQKRRSTLLTPLSADPSFGRDEKGYVIDRGSVGPTPRTERLRADISSNFARVRGRLSSFLGRRDSAPNVNLNRGHSQFMEPLPQHSRSSSRRSSRAGLRGGKLTTKDRFIDWWDRLTEDVNFNWRLRNERNSPELDPFLAARDIKERNDALAASNQPDFLTLLGMDNNQLEREQMKRTSGHGHSGSGGSGHFLGGLGLNFDGRDPFADTPRDSAKPPPLVVSGPSNPFTDANAIPSAPASTIPKPTTYVAEVRRSRGSVSAGSGPTTGGIAASGVRRSRADSYRESLQSVESFATRRNKFRSDPFDLERPELLAGRQKSSSSNPSTARSEVRTPKMAHSRNDSFTSKYTSSTSFADWSDPGPDVGPAATRWDGGSDGRDSPTGRSVGKAM